METSPSTNTHTLCLHNKTVQSKLFKHTDTHTHKRVSRLTQNLLTLWKCCLRAKRAEYHLPSSCSSCICRSGGSQRSTWCQRVKKSSSAALKGGVTREETSWCTPKTSDPIRVWRWRLRCFLLLFRWFSFSLTGNKVCVAHMLWRRRPSAQMQGEQPFVLQLAGTRLSAGTPAEVKPLASQSTLPSPHKSPCGAVYSGDARASGAREKEWLWWARGGGGGAHISGVWANFFWKNTARQPPCIFFSLWMIWNCCQILNFHPEEFSVDHSLRSQWEADTVFIKSQHSLHATECLWGIMASFHHHNAY